LPPSERDRVVVADAGPLMALGRHDLLDLLPQLFGQVWTPTFVLNECTARPELADAQRVAGAVTAGWLRVVDTAPIQLPGLDMGECAAIATAIELQAALLVDDRAARQRAEAIGLAVMGTLGILVLAKRRGLLDSVKPVAERMRSDGHYISLEALQAVMHLTDEA